MKFNKSTNPVLNVNRFEKAEAFSKAESGVMTINGTINKTLMLFALLLVTGIFSWKSVLANPGSFGMYVGIGAIGGLVVAFVTIFNQRLAPYTAPIYALLEGLFIGAISAFYSTIYSGIVIKAVGLTLSVLAIMLLAYKSGYVRATPKFKRIMIIAIGGVMFFYILNFIFSMMGGGVSLFNLGWMGVGIQLVIVGIASLSLILDFDNIENGAKAGLPKYAEWYAGFGLMVTLVWLYLEILRLLALLSDR